MTYYIGSARHDERGKYHGGKAGDQTGQEVATQKLYNHSKGWMAYRAVSPEIAVALKNAMLSACANPNNGYNQYRRYDIVKNGIDTTTPGGCDCSSTVRACIIKATGKDIGDFTTASEPAALEKSGLFTKVGNVTLLSKLYEGDILVTRKKGHTAIVTTGYPRVAVPKIATPKTSGQSVTGNALVKLGQQHSINFTGKSIAVDGIVGPNTHKQMARVVQHAINLDYHANIAEDGIFGSSSKRALGSHYVRKGERQYMVTAAEILCYLNGLDPKGVECPGVYGNGLTQATGSIRLDADWFLSHI